MLPSGESVGVSVKPEGWSASGVASLAQGAMTLLTFCSHCIKVRYLVPVPLVPLFPSSSVIRGCQIC